VLYGKQEQIKFVQCMIKMARFKGTNKTGEFLDNQQIKGNSFRILFEADVFLRRHLANSSVFKLDQFKRIDQPTLPVFAVREALINAICHRDYSNRATDISLAIYDDRLEIWNSGLLLQNLTIENLKREHESILRNKLIANAFYVRGLIEKWGTGINRMIELCKEANLPDPKLTERSGGIAVIFTFKDPLGLPVKTKQNISHSTDDMTERQKVIFTYLKDVKKASMQNIINHLNTNADSLLTKRTILRDLNTLKSLTFIDLKGEKRKAVWVYLAGN
jgi:ATP-dependent DNA helicase RecG